jgi:chlorophyllase
MRLLLRPLSPATLAVLVACGSSAASGPAPSTDAGVDQSSPVSDAGGDARATGDTGPTAPDAAIDAPASADASPDGVVDGALDGATDGAADTASDAPTSVAGDPNAPGAYTYAELDDTMNVAASGDSNVAIHAAYPTAGPTAGPYPVIVVAHGFSLAASQYYGYVQRLASFGYVALTVDFPTSFTVNNPGNAQDLIAGIDWAKANATVGAIADTSTVGMTGHSLGGKLALLAATMDPRVKASIVLDPVDGGTPSCTAPSCVTVAALMPSLHIPTGFLGETTDASGGVGGMSCAPAADNFTTFYAKTVSPSLEVTVLGANHMSFLDDVATCGLVCSFCNAATASNAQVNGLAHAYVAAFYERWLRGNTAYDTYLTGAQAQMRYVTSNEATIVSK